MSVSKCPSCGGTHLVRSAHSTPARGRFGPDLLPGLSSGTFRVVVCKDCGLTSLFASIVDRKTLTGPEWEPMSADGLSSHPLGLDEP